MNAHNEERNRREVTAGGAAVEYTTLDGEVAYRGPICARTRTVSERWCAGCQKWVTIDGIFGRLAWEAEHAAHGDVSP